MSTTVSPRERIEILGLKAALNLPAPLVRALAAPAVRIDGLTLHPEMRLLLRLLDATGGSPLDIPDLAQARAGVQSTGKALDILGGDLGVETRALDIGGRPARLYTPPGAEPGGPLLVYFHGGGFTVGGLDSHAGVARFLAAEAGVSVLASTYRLAPEHPYPAALDDALEAFRFALSEATTLGIDGDRVGVGGDSAGANLAAAVALRTRDLGEPQPCFQALIYPVTDLVGHTRSQDLFAEGLFLTRERMRAYNNNYAPGEARREPYVSVLLAEDHSGLPPAYVTTAGFDTLRDEGEAYAAKLRAAGTPVALRRHADLIHSWINFWPASRRARGAMLELASATRVGLASGARMPTEA